MTDPRPQSRSIIAAVVEHFRTDPDARAAYENAKRELAEHEMAKRAQRAAKTMKGRTTR